MAVSLPHRIRRIMVIILPNNGIGRYRLIPKFVFVTGWNEWVAQRFSSFAGYTAPTIFVDLFSQEFSRDIEPMKGGYGDNYYFQLVNYIRKYKGVQAPAGDRQSSDHDHRRQL